MHIDSTDVTLKRYLDDIRKTAPLTREEEQILFQKAKEGDKIARQKLISANMRFVLKVAIQYRGCPIPLPDLVSEGAMGLVRAIESFEHTRGLKFISYGVWWIKAYITRAINEQGNLIRLPANQHLRVRKALHEQSRWQGNQRRHPGTYPDRSARCFFRQPAQGGFQGDIRRSSR